MNNPTGIEAMRMVNNCVAAWKSNGSKGDVADALIADNFNPHAVNEVYDGIIQSLPTIVAEGMEGVEMPEVLQFIQTYHDVCMIAKARLN